MIPINKHHKYYKIWTVEVEYLVKLHVHAIYNDLYDILHIYIY